MWPYLPALERLVLALALGLFVGLEREWRRKEAGLRTFGFAGMIGCLGGLLGTSFLIASIGFANYILLKLYGARGIELTGFLGGLVNSTVTVAELAGRVRETPELAGVAYRGVMIATAAMVVRNGILLAILAPRALVAAAPALILMLGACLILAFAHGRPTDSNPARSLALPLKSPFSLQSTFKFGLIFLALQVVGTLAQRALGQIGFYAISIAGGLISSASSVASAGSLAARGTVLPDVAGTASVLASLTSALVGLPLVARTARDRQLPQQLRWSIGLVVALGMLGAVLGHIF
jgi:uncharacterized membrane protein (DUF4010 family)